MAYHRRVQLLVEKRAAATIAIQIPAWGEYSDLDRSLTVGLAAGMVFSAASLVYVFPLGAGPGLSPPRPPPPPPNHGDGDDQEDDDACEELVPRTGKGVGRTTLVVTKANATVSSAV